MSVEWARCRDWIRDAIAHGGNVWTERAVFDAILSGKMQLWTSPNAAMVTEIVHYPAATAVRGFLGGGDLRELVDQITPAVIDWARSIGAKRVETGGRRGWVKVFPDWEHHAYLFKEL